MAVGPAQDVAVHDELRFLLFIYVDDFKLAAPADALAKAWKTISLRVEIGAPEPFNRYFGCFRPKTQCLRAHHHEAATQARGPAAGALRALQHVGGDRP